MKAVTILYRKKKEGRYSIERLFSPIDKLSGVNRVELPYDLTSILNGFKLFLFALNINGKTIHITGDVHYMAFFLFWKNIVITIHDCNHYENLKGLRRFLVGLIWFRIPILVSKKIIVISPFVKKQLQEHFKVEDKKVVIIPNSFYSMEKFKSNIFQEFFKILVIGTKKNKNIIRLFEAIKGIENIKLQIIGRLQNEQINLMEEYNISYSNYFDISQHELNELYNSSQILYFASTKEGFGLPILEAQSCGLPVLTSNTTSMPYVAGSGAKIIDPYNVDEIRKAVLELINNEDLRMDLIEKGFANIERFNQTQFVSNYIKIYNSLK